MGLFKPTVRIDQPKSGEVNQLKAWAKLPKSQSAEFIQLVGILAIIGGVLTAGDSPPLGFAIMLAGGVTIAGGHLQQAVFDIRTLMLREAKMRSEITPDTTT